MKEHFVENFYIEIQRGGLKRDLIAEPILIEIAYELKVPIVATNDSYFRSSNDFDAHEILMMIDKSQTVSSSKTRFLSRENYLKTSHEMIDLFQDIPEVLAGNSQM